MKMKVLKMAVLVLALLVVSGLRAMNMTEAKAEEASLFRFEVGRASMWEKSYLEIIDRVESDEITIKKGDPEVPERLTVEAKHVPVSNFFADQLTFVYHDGELCMYTYMFSDGLNEERYEYLRGALTSRYGTASKEDFAAYELSDCPGAEYIEDSMDAACDMKRGEKGLGQKLILPLIVGSTPEEMYVWDIDDHTHVTMYYCEQTSIFSNDALFILYSNKLPHGAASENVPEEAYNADGL